MLIDVNLLPKKEPKNVMLFVGLAFVLAAVLAAGITFYVSAERSEADIVALTKELKETRARVAEEQQKLENVQTAQDVNELKQTVEWAKQYPLKTVLLLRNMATLLPERGFIIGFAYKENGTVKVIVQFDTSEEAAYYLRQLSDAPFASDVRLQSVTALQEGNGETAEATERGNVLPRYLAEYELHVNKAALKEEKEKQP